jgi:hypothetical protein
MNNDSNLELNTSEGSQNLDPNIWGPHYWFFLHTIAITYPNNPNAIIKKQYYELIQNLPMFLPCLKSSKHFEKVLNMYPIEPYLKNRESLVRWMHFVHNKLNEMLDKPTITLNDFYFQYFDAYKSNESKRAMYFKWKTHAMYVGVIVVLCGIIGVAYSKGDP